jgi:hypothetical protein
MRSSTSVSSSAALSHAKIVVGICAVLVLLLESFSNYVLQHDSATYTRVSQQYAQAVQTRPAAPGQPTAVLMVGNSLLLHGVQLDRLRTLTSSQMRISPIFLEATGYYDWFYGLRRLFREGAKPQVVVVGVGVNYFLEDGVRPEYSSKLLFDARDALAVASDLHLDHTATSNLLLAHVSTFWDTRTAIRTQVLRRIIPGIQDLFLLISPRPAIPQGHEFEVIAVPRLQRLRDLCEANGAKLVLLVPPTLSSGSATDEMARAAHLVGVEVSVPIDPAALSAGFYQSDGMHLNHHGAILFTAALAKDLPERITVSDATISSTASSCAELPRDGYKCATSPSNAAGNANF